MEDYSEDISAADWGKGIALSVLASLIGGASKLAIRKSWLLQEEIGEAPHGAEPANDANSESSPPPEAPLTLDTASVTSSEENFPVLIAPDETEQRRRRLKWIILTARYGGMVGMSLLNPICCVLAMNYASPSILAPFSGLTMVWVILLSPAVNGEQPSRAQIIASVLIIAGEVTVAVFGDHTNDVDISVQDVISSYRNPYFLLYFAALGSYLSLLAYWINCSDSPVLRRFAWGSCGGSITGLQNFLKDSLTLFKVSGALQHWLLPFFLAMAAASAFLGLLMLTACMKRYDATYSAASFVGSFVVSASIMSAVHYDTFSSLENAVDFFLYPTGLLILMVGVYMLVRESEAADELLFIENDGDEQIVPVRKNTDDSSQLPFMYTKVDDEGQMNHGPVV